MSATSGSRQADLFQFLPATKKDIIEGCKWLVSNTSEGDSLFFHYSGHGIQVDDQDGDGLYYLMISSILFVYLRFLF